MKEETLEKTNSLLNKTAKGTAFGLTTPKIDNVRVGIIGAGNRGQTLIQMFDWLVKNNHATIVAISDLRKEKTDKFSIVEYSICRLINLNTEKNP